MTIEKAKELIASQKNKKRKFRYNGARNQIEVFEGIITGIYNAVFTIETVSYDGRLKSFTYSDVIMENLEIIE